MLRHHAAAHSPAAMRLLYSARSPRDLVYGQELSRLADVDPGVDVQLTFTRPWPANWNGQRGRIARGPLERIALDPGAATADLRVRTSGFVEAVATGWWTTAISPRAAS
jgi:ferredoxin-NADP reductase